MRKTLRQRIADMGMLDLPVVVKFYAERNGTPARRFPNASKMMEAHGLDLAGGVSSPELTRDYIAEYCQLNKLKA